jgi:hypothetical protein
VNTRDEDLSPMTNWLDALRAANSRLLPFKRAMPTLWPA